MGPKCSHKSLQKGARGDLTKKERQSDEGSRDRRHAPDDGRRGHKPWNIGSPQTRRQISPRSLQKERSPADMVILAH